MKPMSTTDNFANGTSAVYVDMLYDQWKEDPNSVHASWRSYFDNVEKGEQEPYAQPPGLGRSNKTIDLDTVIKALKESGFASGATVSEVGSSADI